MNRMTTSLQDLSCNQFTEESFTKFLIHQKFASINQLLRIKAICVAYVSKPAFEIFL